MKAISLEKAVSLLKTLLKVARSSAAGIFNQLFIVPKIFIDRYYIEDNAGIVVYTSNQDQSRSFSPAYPQRSLHEHSQGNQPVKVSLIATVRNEAGNVKDWAKSVFAQTRLPDEIIITDAGSTDGTPGLLNEVSMQSPVPFHIIPAPEANISKGRNIAIAKAGYDLIATTDFGCRLHPTWLEKITAPFELDPGTDVSAGMYQAVDRNGKKIDRRAWWTNDAQINLKWFLPSARSSAFTRSIWERVGGYPEWLSLTGEDTFFALELKKFAKKWAFVPAAVVDWHAPDTTIAYWRKMYTWSIGEGESGLYASSYWKLSIQILLLALLLLGVLLLQAFIWIFPVLTVLQPLVYMLAFLWVMLFAAFCINLKLPFSHLISEFGGLVAKILGFLHGAQHRHQVDRKRGDRVKGTIFILSGVPIDDTGGGARCTQIALELLRQKYAVVFINKFPKYESRDLNLSIHDNFLYTFPLSEFNWSRFIEQHGWLLGNKTMAALIEMPIADFLPVVNEIRNNGGVIAYDLLDDWDTQLGGNWFSEATEAEIIKVSQVLVATAPILVERLARMSNRSVEALPNAVNTYLFNPDRAYERPLDLPKSDWTAIYTGALWGEWFDWNLLAEVASKYPEACVAVIGDYRGQCPVKLPNLHFLGLKPQKAIPAYLAFSDVAIIPWKANKITQATSPLKVYEYLAMRVPVVSADIHPLRDLPGVFLARDQSEFLDLVGEARKAVLPCERVDQFISENNWQSRVSRLLELVNTAQQQYPNHLS